MDTLTKIKNAKESLANLEENFKKAKADMSEEDKYYAMFDYFYNSISGLRSYLYAMEDRMYEQMLEHKVGHLPPIKSAGKMEKALKALGCEDDYEIQRPILRVTASNQNIKTFDIDLKIKK